MRLILAHHSAVNRGYRKAIRLLNMQHQMAFTGAAIWQPQNQPDKRMN
jgi:hypothetical protein